MRIEHDELVTHLHQARRERLKSLYARLGEVFDYTDVWVSELLRRIRIIEAVDVFQKAREVAEQLEREEP